MRPFRIVDLDPVLCNQPESGWRPRVSTRSQDLANQKLAILEFSQKPRFPIDQFIESRISSRKSPLERRIDEMLGTLQPGRPSAGQRVVAARPQPLSTGGARRVEERSGLGRAGRRQQAGGAAGARDRRGRGAAEGDL